MMHYDRLHQPNASKTLLCVALAFTLAISANSAAMAQDKSGKDGLQMLEIEPELDSGKQTEQPSQAPAANSVSSGDKPLAAKAVVVDVNSKTLTYDQERDAYIATGSVHVVISEQNSELFADQVIYDQNQSLLIAEGHVVIHKNGEKTLGSFAKIDLTRQSALINDIATKVDQVRIKAQQAMVANQSQIFENGRLIISPEMFGAVMGENTGKGMPVAKKTEPNKASNKSQKVAKASNKPVSKVKVDPFSEQALSSLATTDINAASTQDQKLVSQDSVDLDDPNTGGWGENEFIHVKAKEINMYRWKDGYTKVDAKKPALYAGKYKIAGLPDAQFSQDSMTEEMEYLGPDVGYDPDMGGFYYGPGYDFRLGEGSVRFSPYASIGGGTRKRRGGSSRYENPGKGPGIGGILHYRGNDTKIDFAYSSNVNQPVLYAEKSFFDKKTRLIGSVNEDYVNGFMGFERPGFGVMLADGRQVGEWGKFRLDTFSSVGFFKDDFFPNNKTVDLINFDKTGDPATAGRVQFQAQFANSKPLYKVGDWLYFGFKTQVAGAGYTTGDMIGIIRGGPTMTLKYKDRWRTSMRYFLAHTAGESPFLFDQYYYGRHQVGLTNTWNVNDYVAVGMSSQIAATRDNAKGALFTGNQFFVMFGPKSVKLNLAYDVVRQRSYFGLTFLPDKKGKPVDFDTLRVFSPDQYQPAP